MSEDTKKAAQLVKYSLQNAASNLSDAEYYANRTGDKSLVKEVIELRTKVQKSKNNLCDKLNKG